MTGRFRQLAWILYLLDDVVCDFQAIYHLRVDPDLEDFAGLSGRQFFRLTTRLPRYEGAVASRMREWRDDRDREQPQGSASQPVPQPTRTVEASPQALLSDPLFSQFIEYG